MRINELQMWRKQKMHERRKESHRVKRERSHTGGWFANELPVKDGGLKLSARSIRSNYVGIKPNREAIEKLRRRGERRDKGSKSRSRTRSPKRGTKSESP